MTAATGPATPADPWAGVAFGQGFDAHRFAAPGSHRPLWLAGLDWGDGCGEGLDGDSDGDVAVHALIDALLAAAGLGDIGRLFGVGSDARGAGMHGLPMLRDTVRHLRAHGAVPLSVSVSVVAVRPHLSRRRDEAEAALGEAAGCPVTLTATTSDGMGFTGRGEGVAAIAGALVRRGR